ncbi:hypothetical protein L7F22_012305 [Adiantum nelumboides]|nr:hypothetical protein [Adiantum nelumboides]
MPGELYRSPQFEVALAVLGRFIGGDLDRGVAALELTAPVTQAFQRKRKRKRGKRREEDDALKGSAEMWLWDIWRALMYTVRTIAHNDPAQDELVHLLSAIKELQMRPTSASSTFWGGKFWLDLPILGPEVREEWYFSPPYDDYSHFMHYTREQWASMNAFVARLSVAHVLNFKLYGIWTMRHAFEEHEGTLLQDEHVPAAATWVLEAGHLMYELAVKAQPPDNIERAANGGSLWAGRIWYSLERWAFWKQGFKAAMAQADSWTKEMATRAYQTMEQIEQQAGQH